MRPSLADCRMVYEPRKQLMAWIETDYSKQHELLMEDKMATGVFGRARNMAEMASLNQVSL